MRDISCGAYSLSHTVYRSLLHLGQAVFNLGILQQCVTKKSALTVRALWLRVSNAPNVIRFATSHVWQEAMLPMATNVVSYPRHNKPTSMIRIHPLFVLVRELPLRQIFGLDFSERFTVNNSTCNFMSLARGLLNLQTAYTIVDVSLGRVDSIRDLGVMIGSTMSFDVQISTVVKKSLKILGFIKNVSSDFRRPSTLTRTNRCCYRF